MNAFKRVEPIATAVLTLCAIVLTIGYARNAFFPPSAEGTPIERVSDWETFVGGNMAFGAKGAPLHIVEFSDFECPACRKLHRTVQALRARDSSAVLVTYRNYPLDDLHPTARAAATAAQCAANQGAFQRMHDHLFEHQTTLGTLEWGEVAEKVGVPDTAAFRNCLTAPETRVRLSQDSAAAIRLSIDGTPLVLVNGHLIRGAPKASLLDSLLNANIQAKY